MPEESLTAQAAAQRLGISVTTLYDWLSAADRGLLVIRGQAVTLHYFQGGPRGQGRIRIAATEIERLQECMRVQPLSTPRRRPPLRLPRFPGIFVELGRPPAS